MHQIKGKKLGVETASNKNQVYYPNFSIELEYLPEARKWEIGKTYKIALEVKQTSVREGSGDNSVGFDIKGIGVMNHEDKGEPIKKKSAKVARRYDDKEKDAII